MTSPDDHTAYFNDCYRAIGRYVYCFSRVVYWMKCCCEDVGIQRLTQILTGDMTAYQVSSSFFGICAERYEHTDDERKIAKAVRKRVADAIEFRNSIAHGDWMIGWARAEGDPIPPILNRVRPGRSGDQWTGEVLDPQDLDRRSDELEVLRKEVHQYGMTAGGSMSTPRLGHPGTRPSDVFVIKDGVVKLKDDLDLWVG